MGLVESLQNLELQLVEVNVHNAFLEEGLVIFRVLEFFPKRVNLVEEVLKGLVLLTRAEFGEEPLEELNTDIPV